MKIIVGNKTIEAKPFNPAEFFRSSGSVKFDPSEPRVVLAEMNLANVGMISTLREGERSITGEENISRLKTSNHVRLGADALVFFWENQQFIPKNWDNKIFFDGDIFMYPSGDRFSLYLFYCWSWGGWSWHWNPGILSCRRFPGYSSAVMIH